jgi:hypothetical protein
VRGPAVLHCLAIAQEREFIGIGHIQVVMIQSLSGVQVFHREHPESYRADGFIQIVGPQCHGSMDIVQENSSASPMANVAEFSSSHIACLVIQTAQTV